MEWFSIEGANFTVTAVCRYNTVVEKVGWSVREIMNIGRSRYWEMIFDRRLAPEGSLKGKG